MKKVKIGNIINNSSTYSKNCFNKPIFQYCNLIIIYTNFLLTIYLLLRNNQLNLLNKELLSSNFFSNQKESGVDQDMVGLKYPEIQFNKIRTTFINGKIISGFLDLLTQLETKLIYLEKDINATKLNSFYTTRILYLKNINVTYDDSRIVHFNDIINWLIIHKSDQLKGIASDKYLACKYVKMKIGKNLCPQRIGVYDTIEEIDFEKLIKMGNVVLKVSNGNSDNIFITKKYTIKDIERIKKLLYFHFNRNYPLITPSFIHLFSKKRIVLEKMFIPITHLYEFRFFIFNNDIKMIMLNYIKNRTMVYEYYDKNFNSMKNGRNKFYVLPKFEESVLNEMKKYAIQLSEDFPNFIRVDLYIFHNKVYLSELTFDSHAGLPAFMTFKNFTDEIKKWKRVDY